jgi:hypothetical protein
MSEFTTKQHYESHRGDADLCGRGVDGLRTRVAFAQTEKTGELLSRRKKNRCKCTMVASHLLSRDLGLVESFLGLLVALQLLLELAEHVSESHRGCPC